MCVWARVREFASFSVVMAREFDDLGFWLPSEFLTDDDLLTDFKSDRLKTRRFNEFSFGYGNSLPFNSDLSSPGDRVTSPTETESEEDDLVSELTRKLAQSTLRNSNFSSHHTSKGWKLSSSPQSTLCGCKFGSSGSPNSVSGVCSPPDAEDHLRRDYLYAAAEEVARMRMIEETAAFYSSKRLPPQVKPSPSPTAGFYPNQARSQNHISSQLLQAAKQQQMLKKGVYGPRVMEFQLHNGRRNCDDGRAHGLAIAAWPGLQQPSSGTRAVFHGEPEPKKERTGTGVFLPKRLGAIPTVSRKKSGCPTVLLPEKVVHALNLDVGSIDAHLQRSIDYGTSNFDYDAAAAALKHRNNVMMVAQQRRNLAAQAAMSQQLTLPQDWTY